MISKREIIAEEIAVAIAELYADLDPYALSQDERYTATIDTYRNILLDAKEQRDFIIRDFAELDAEIKEQYWWEFNNILEKFEEVC